MIGRRTQMATVATLLAALTVPGLVTTSLATFTSTSGGAASQVSSASDWTAPTVQLADPGAAVAGTATLSATATDQDSGVASVRIERAAAGASSWTTVCTTSTAPYRCSWATAGLANGSSWQLRAVATDRAGNTATSATRTTIVDNQAPTGSHSASGFFGLVIGGNLTWTASVHDAHSGVATVEFQYRTTGAWQTACVRTSGQASCSLGLPDGTYELRIIATDLAGNTATSTSITRTSTLSGYRSVQVLDGGASSSAATMGVTTLGTTATAASSPPTAAAPAAGMTARAATVPAEPTAGVPATSPVEGAPPAIETPATGTRAAEVPVTEAPAVEAPATDAASAETPTDDADDADDAACPAVEDADLLDEDAGHHLGVAPDPVDLDDLDAEVADEPDACEDSAADPIEATPAERDPREEHGEVDEEDEDDEDGDAAPAADLDAEAPRPTE